MPSILSSHFSESLLVSLPVRGSSDATGRPTFPVKVGVIGTLDQRLEKVADIADIFDDETGYGRVVRMI